MHQNLVDRTWKLGNLMLSAAGRPLYVTVLIANNDREVLAIRHGWAGGEPSKPSRAPYFGPWKAIEMVETIALGDPPVVMTPVQGFEGSGYMGGVRRLSGDHWLVTTGSAWSEKADALMALGLNHAMLFETRFHHVGFRHASESLMRSAVERDENRLGVKAKYLPTDHERYFLRVRSPEAANGVYWIEHQFFPEGPFAKGIHWDLATSGDLLGFLGSGLKVSPDTWEAGALDPFGLVGLTDRDDMHLAIMQRNIWTDVGNW